MSEKINISDRIYGDFEISEPVILELINSEPMQRLKKIYQSGFPQRYFGNRKVFTRYEHCVGVMLLLRRLGASLEEQIAGLLHDMSHTAFSHVVDWVLNEGGTRNPNFQDNAHLEKMKSSAVCMILEKYGYSVEQMADYHNFGLLERNIPDVCADRIDYSLRECSLDVTEKSVSGMITKNEKIIFKERESASTFALAFLNLQRTFWCEFDSMSRYKILASALRLALEKKVIDFEDFWRYDDFVLNKLVVSGDPKIIRLLKVLENEDLTDLPISNKVAHEKFRYVDPEFLDNGVLMRLSVVDSDFKKEIEVARKENDQGGVVVDIDKI